MSEYAFEAIATITPPKPVHTERFAKFFLFKVGHISVLFLFEERG